MRPNCLHERSYTSVSHHVKLIEFTTIVNAKENDIDRRTLIITATLSISDIKFAKHGFGAIILKFMKEVPIEIEVDELLFL